MQSGVSDRDERSIDARSASECWKPSCAANEEEKDALDEDELTVIACSSSREYSPCGRASKSIESENAA